MKVLLKSRHIWYFVGAIAAFWFSAYFLSFYPLSTPVRAFSLWIALAVLITYGQWGIEAIRNPADMTADRQGFVGINLIALGTVIQAIIIVYSRIAYPKMPIMSDWTTFGVALQTSGLAFLFMAPGAIRNRVLHRNRILIALLAAGGIMAVFLLATYGGLN